MGLRKSHFTAEQEAELKRIDDNFYTLTQHPTLANEKRARFDHMFTTKYTNESAVVFADGELERFLRMLQNLIFEHYPQIAKDNKLDELRELLDYAVLRAIDYFKIRNELEQIKADPDKSKEIAGLKNKISELEDKIQSLTDYQEYIISQANYAINEEKKNGDEKYQKGFEEGTKDCYTRAFKDGYEQAEYDRQIEEKRQYMLQTAMYNELQDEFFDLSEEEQTRLIKEEDEERRQMELFVKNNPQAFVPRESR